jgi:hypothetical protein
MTQPKKVVLGSTQIKVLKSLVKRGSWYAGCGWMWDTRSGTERLMEALVKKGVATKATATIRYRPDGPPVKIVKYEPTDDGVQMSGVKLGP